jgi:hypothetical protein
MNARGVSLIELILYVAMASLILLSMGLFTADILLGRQKAALIDKSTQVSRIAWERMNREIEAAVGINTGSSTFSSHPGVLSLIMPDASNDPTVFDVSGGRLRMTQGANPSVFLTPPNMTVSNLVFENYSSGSVYVVNSAMTVIMDLANGDTTYTTDVSYQTSVLLHNP